MQPLSITPVLRMASDRPNPAPSQQPSRSRSLASSEQLQRCLQEWRQQGYAVLPSFLPAHTLQAMQRECTRLSALEQQGEDWHERGYVVESMASGTIAEDAPARFCARAYTEARARSIGARCSPSGRGPDDPVAVDIAADNAAVCELLFRNVSLLRVIHALLASGGHAARAGGLDPSVAAPSVSRARVWLFNEQYVCKPPHTPEAEFGWHTDRREQLALYNEPAGATPYLACWCALDDMSAENGTLRIVQRDALRRWQDARTSSPSADPTAAAAAGDASAPLPVSDALWLSEHSTPLLVPAGSVVLFDGDCWHASTGNQSDAPRRVFYAQYSLEPIAARRSVEEGADGIQRDAQAETQPRKKQRTETATAAASAAKSALHPASPCVADPHASLCASCGSGECAQLALQLDPLSFAIQCEVDERSAGALGELPSRQESGGEDA